MGETGMDETEMQTGIELMGYEFTAVTMKGKLFADTLEGTISVKGKKATLEILSPVGKSSELWTERRLENLYSFIWMEWCRVSCTIYQ